MSWICVQVTPQFARVNKIVVIEFQHSANLISVGFYKILWDFLSILLFSLHHIKRLMYWRIALEAECDVWKWKWVWAMHGWLVLCLLQWRRWCTGETPRSPVWCSAASWLSCCHSATWAWSAWSPTPLCSHSPAPSASVSTRTSCRLYRRPAKATRSSQ